MINPGEFYICGGDYFGKNCPNELFNKTYVPRLKELGIKDENMKEVARMFEEIYSIGYSNGLDNAGGFDCD
jgi:hypothetical protein